MTLTPYRPLPIKLLNGTGKALGISKPKLDGNAIFDKALKQQSHSHNIDYSTLRERLTMLCASIESHGNLTTTGRLLTYLSLVNTIKNRLALDEYFEQHAEVANNKIEQPIFILGLPRTGTTALFNMLSKVEGLRSPLGWEVNKPIPPVKFAEKDSDKRIKQTHQEFEAFFYLTPELRVIHDFGALLPQECIAITQYDLYTGQFFFCYDIPEYFNWYKQHNPLSTLQFHKQFLQIIQSDFPEQTFLLKTPFHITALKQIFSLYPDARIIQTHRNPMQVMASVCSFAWHLRSTFSDQIDALQIGKDQLTFWGNGLNQVIRDRDELPEKANQIFDLDYQTFILDPVSCVNQILDFLNIEKTEHTAQQLVDHVNNNQKDKHGKHVYQLADYGLDTQRDQQVFTDYCHRFHLKMD